MQAGRRPCPPVAGCGSAAWLDRAIDEFLGAYNCTSTNLVDWQAAGLMMDLAMMGCGTGAIIEPHLIERLLIVRNELKVMSDIGCPPAGRGRLHRHRRQPGHHQGGRHPARLG